MFDEQVVNCLKKVEEKVNSNLKLISNCNDDMQLVDNLIEIVFKCCVNLYSSEKIDENKVMLDFVQNVNLKIEDDFLKYKFEDYKEYLFYIYLIKHMPKCVNKHCYLSHKHKICNEKYIADFALLDIETNNPVIIILIDKFNEHISQLEISKKNKIDREIQSFESVNIWHYTECEIKNDLDFLTKDFWDYVISNII